MTIRSFVLSGLPPVTPFFLTLALVAACSNATPDLSEAAVASTDPASSGPDGYVPGYCPSCAAEQLVFFDLAVATLPFDPQPRPTDMNGFIFDVGDEGILANPTEHTWWESPADLQLTCPASGAPPGPCRAMLGPLDISRVVAANRPILVRTRPTSDASAWSTVMTVLTPSQVTDGNMLSATAYVLSDQGVPALDAGFGLPAGTARAQGGVIGLMADANGQLPPGARLELVDPGLVGQPLGQVASNSLRKPGWVREETAYATVGFQGQAQWGESLVSPAVFAWAPLASPGQALPAAWVAVKDALDPLISEIVSVDLVLGNFVVLPLTLRPRSSLGGGQPQEYSGP